MFGDGMAVVCMRGEVRFIAAGAASDE